jgi:hypothetical protein
MIASLVAVEPRLARRDRAFAMGLEANIVGALAASVIATWLEIFPNDLYLWLLVTIACAAATPDPESS